jgi:hypothetical protein
MKWIEESGSVPWSPCTGWRISAGVFRSMRDGVPVKAGDRIADVDPRGATDDLDHVSDKSHRVAEGVHEALLGLIARKPKKTRRRAS